jgi:hypothetical protein
MAQIINFESYRSQRIIRKAMAMMPMKRIVGYCSSPDASAYVQSVWDEAKP